MALFGKKKEEEKIGAPPLPPPGPMSPSPSTGIEKNPVSGDGIPRPNPQVSNLSPPPVPGGNLNDIKNEIAIPSSKVVSDSSEEDSNIGIDYKQDNNDTLLKKNDDDKNLDDEINDESLFDFSELDMGGINQENDAIKPEEVQNDLETIKSGFSSGYVAEPGLKFMDHKRKSNETYFLTTKQFKTLLEIVENVKVKVKDASETHLKLLDIKSEEDIEFENLRKDFQFIEDKLYEVDSIIFER